MYGKEHQAAKEKTASVMPARTNNEGSMEALFGEFGERASEFVRQVSSMHDFSYRGDNDSIEENVRVTKKVFSKWSVEILVSLYSRKSMGFGDLKRLLKGISSRVLSQKLKDLQELGLLERQIVDSRPPTVRYTLSKKGETLARLGEPVILYLRHEEGT